MFFFFFFLLESRSLFFVRRHVWSQPQWISTGGISIRADEFFLMHFRFKAARDAIRKCFSRGCPERNRRDASSMLGRHFFFWAETRLAGLSAGKSDSPGVAMKDFSQFDFFFFLFIFIISWKTHENFDILLSYISLKFNLKLRVIFPRESVFWKPI